jgi:GNAT superfamily N-acetyltransferase
MNSKICSIVNNLEILPATRAAYDELAHFHYRASCPAVYAAIYAMYHTWHGRLGHVKSGSGVSLVNSSFFNQQQVTSNQQPELPIGVIVYTMPAMEIAARNLALAQMFTSCRNRSDRMKIINKNIRCISRVIIDPRYRGLGLASRLVRETMPLLNVPLIEALAVMGRINPFFEKAGMTAYPAKLPRHCERMSETLKIVSIEEHLFISPAEVQKKLDALCGQLKFWLEHQIEKFLNAYGKRRNMPPGLERTRFILSKLTAESIYYVWRRGDS